MPRLVGNRIVTLVVRAIDESGDEINLTMIDTSGARQFNQRMLGQIAELQTELAMDISASLPRSK